jgi:hypothetical protein
VPLFCLDIASQPYIRNPEAFVNEIRLKLSEVGIFWGNFAGGEGVEDIGGRAEIIGKMGGPTLLLRAFLQT